MLNIEQLIEKLRKVEALYAGAASPGERAAAGNALERIRDRLKQAKGLNPPIEYSFRFHDHWSRQLFTALCRRYGLEPYRYTGQRHTTVMVKVPAAFVKESLWPEFEQINTILTAFLHDVTSRVIREQIFADDSEPRVAAAAGLPLEGT